MKKSRNIKNYFSSSSLNFNTSLKKEINNRIYLQEKILKDEKKAELQASTFPKFTSALIKKQKKFQ